MIGLEVFGQTPAMTAVAERLHQLGGVGRVRIETAVRDGHSLVLATVSHDVTDQTLRELRALSIPREDVTLTRVEELGGGVIEGSHTSLIWADVVGLAGSNARILGRYVTFMAVAGVIACNGIVDATRS
jgi:hypothetical protein